MTSKVFVSLRVRASPERAFEVFTQDIARWWAPNPAFRTTPSRPGALDFEGGTRLIETLSDGKIFEIGRVTAWEPPHRLAFTWRQASFPPDLITSVEVTFEAVGDQTRVSVIHTGFDTVPAQNAARHGMSDAVLLGFLGKFWRGNLESLNKKISG